MLVEFPRLIYEDANIYPDVKVYNQTIKIQMKLWIYKNKQLNARMNDFDWSRKCY